MATMPKKKKSEVQVPLRLDTRLVEALDVFARRQLRSRNNAIYFILVERMKQEGLLEEDEDDEEGESPAT